MKSVTTEFWDIFHSKPGIPQFSFPCFSKNISDEKRWNDSYQRWHKSNRDLFWCQRNYSKLKTLLITCFLGRVVPLNQKFDTYFNINIALKLRSAYHIAFVNIVKNIRAKAVDTLWHRVNLDRGDLIKMENQTWESLIWRPVVY